MHFVRKAGIVLVSLVLSFSIMLSACSKSGGGDPGSGVGSDQATPEQGVDFSYTLGTRFISWLNDLNWYPELLNRTNTKINLVDGGDAGQYDANIDLAVGGGRFTDAGFVTLSQAEVYGSQGAFLDLKPLIEKYAPNIKQYIDDHPDFKKLVTASDGKIYGLIVEYPNIAKVPFYRKDMFDKAGVTKEPRTIEELTDALRKLKAFYGKNDKNYFPFSGRDSFIAFTEAFHANDEIDNGKVHGVYKNGRGFDIYSPGFQQLITWYNQMYKEGLIDPEWITGAITEDSWGTKMLTGKTSLSYDFYTRPAYFMLNGGPQNDPNYQMKALPYLLDDKGKQSINATYEIYDLSSDFVINAKSMDKAPGILKFLDYLHSKDGQTLLGWGVEGASYKVSNGKNEYTVDYDTEVPKPLGTKKWSFLQDQLTFPKPINNEAFFEWNNKLTKDFASKLFTNEYVKSYPILKYSTDQLKERAGLIAKVNESVMSNLVKFITGSQPLSDWDNFLANMESQGYKKIVTIDQNAYDAMSK